ncbi:MAG: hypothetical protein RI947_282 [Candidatus Parcubacteria bacterium]|jgi:hypothetical protein
MRKISLETDYTQVYIILAIIFIYFQIAFRVREYNYQPLLTFIFFLINSAFTVLFFYLFAKIFKKTSPLSTYIFTFAYSLIPTFIWFLSNSALYYFLPPPRTISVLGKAFSLFFLSFSISLLLWKVILFYLFVRFSTKLPFFSIIFLISLYLAIIAPYTVILYRLDISRIPFL